LSGLDCAAAGRLSILGRYRNDTFTGGIDRAPLHAKK
jgi:hypothetical protein